jgi:hypothetical protein
MTMFNRDVFYDSVRTRVFNGKLSQSQVNGMDIVLDAWEIDPPRDDLRHLGYMFATTYHETAQKMQPVPENGKGSGQPYGKTDPETKQAYYGRGFVQLTWRDNYARADSEMNWSGDQSCEWNADLQLQAVYAAPTMFKGMEEGWFRSSSDGKRQTLDRWFNETKDDPYNAREIINGDKHIVPSWSSGVSIGNLIKGYYMDFTAALNEAYIGDQPEPGPEPEPSPEPVPEITVTITVSAPPGVKIEVIQIEEETS